LSYCLAVFAGVMLLTVCVTLYSVAPIIAVVKTE
jgi:hypothetical protein